MLVKELMGVLEKEQTIFIRSIKERKVFEGRAKKLSFYPEIGNRTVLCVKGILDYDKDGRMWGGIGVVVDE